MWVLKPNTLPPGQWAPFLIHAASTPWEAYNPAANKFARGKFSQFSISAIAGTHPFLGGEKQCELSTLLKDATVQTTKL